MSARRRSLKLLYKSTMPWLLSPRPQLLQLPCPQSLILLLLQLIELGVSLKIELELVHIGLRSSFPSSHYHASTVKWPAFWNSAIHKNDQVMDVDKFNYPRSLLECTALDAISRLTLSAMNYQEAVEILQKRFGSKPLIISKHMGTLLNVEPVASDQSLKELRDTTESHLCSLRSLGVKPTSYGAMLSPVLLMKLPPELHLIVSRKISSTNLNMDSLLKIFEEELVARERASSLKTSHTQLCWSKDRGKYQSSALLTKTQEAGAGLSCCYCQQSHSLVDCTAVININTRKQMLKSNGHCFNCLHKGHIVADHQASEMQWMSSYLHLRKGSWNAAETNATTSYTDWINQVTDRT